jgi:hypothetical protein
MRTTVTLDPDAEQVVRDRMSAKGISFKQALNDAIRDGANGLGGYVFESLPPSPGSYLLDVTKANALAGELEDQGLIEKMRSGK